MTEEEIATARAKWRYRGQTRPPWAIEPQAGQESVWDYPRPPSVDPSDQLVEVKTGDSVLAPVADELFESKRLHALLHTITGKNCKLQRL